MNYKLIILPSAKLDLRKIAKSYEDVQKGLGKRLLKNTKAEIKIVTSNPNLFQIRFDNIRVIIVKKFPYLIHYEIYDKLIVVKAIYHSSRDSTLNIY
jgi:mRNA-degrading endonuclease RelE of RelBE toxin-antitoxin system